MGTRKPKVLVAMSGGVDSSVAAALLLRAGYEAVGVFMRLGSPGETLDELTPAPPTTTACNPAKVKIGHQGCCSINDADDARQVAAALGIPFYVVNFKKDFGRIIDYFADEYAAGRTPNPCVRCNDWLKFGKLHDYARQIGADFVASGHYARVENGRLLRGIDTDKDQSYVLFGVPREQLATMLLPIGAYRKPAVREMAREFGLPVFDKPDSQEICFVPDNDYAALVERRRPNTVRPGVIEDEQGNEIGTHEGHHRFTIGQRRGIGVARGYPLYVIAKDPATNRVTVGNPDALLSSSCTVSEANWLIESPPSGRGRGGCLESPPSGRGRGGCLESPPSGRGRGGLSPSPAPSGGGVMRSMTEGVSSISNHEEDLGCGEPRTIEEVVPAGPSRERGDGSPLNDGDAGTWGGRIESPPSGRGRGGLSPSPAPSGGGAEQGEAEGGFYTVLAQYRAHGEPVPARVRLIDDATDDTPSGRRARFEITFDEPQRAVAPGQAIVLYDASDPDLVLAGGWIEHAIT